MIEYREGQTVEFPGHKGTTNRGVVTRRGPMSRGRRRYTVETTNGETFTVPGELLTPIKLNPASTRALLETARAKDDARAKKQALRAARRGGETFLTGMPVEVFSHGDWIATTVCKVDNAAGKVTVLNPVSAEGRRIAASVGRRISKTITVGANKVRRRTGEA